MEYAVLIPKEKFDQLVSDLEHLKDLIQNNQAPSRNNPTDLITIKQFRAILGICHKTEWDWRTKKENPVVPYVRYGKKIYYRKADVEKFIADHAIEPKTAF